MYTPKSKSLVLRDFIRGFTVDNCNQHVFTIPKLKAVWSWNYDNHSYISCDNGWSFGHPPIAWSSAPCIPVYLLSVTHVYFSKFRCVDDDVVVFTVQKSVCSYRTRTTATKPGDDAVIHCRPISPGFTKHRITLHNTAMSLVQLSSWQD